eukprot:scaffold7882_cov18-Tisochrysis_lutea.AAC.1
MHTCHHSGSLPAHSPSAAQGHKLKLYVKSHKQNLALCKANFSSSSGQLDEAQERQAVSASTCLRGHYVGRVP